MAFDLDSITSGTQIRPPRIILLGESKVGKTTFASQTDLPIFIQIKNEEGMDDIDCPKFPVCETFQDVINCITSLYNEDHDFRTVVLDSTSALEPLIWSSACQRNGNVKSIEDVKKGFGKGYVEAIQEWRQIAEGFDALRSKKNIACILIGHTRIRRHDDPMEGSYDRNEWDIHGKASDFLTRWADAVLFAAFKTTVRREEVGFNKEVRRAIDTTEGQRHLYTQRRPSHPAGGRGVFGRLPYQLPLSWLSYIDAIGAANQKAG